MPVSLAVRSVAFPVKSRSLGLPRRSAEIIDSALSISGPNRSATVERRPATVYAGSDHCTRGGQTGISSPHPGGLLLPKRYT